MASNYIVLGGGSEAFDITPSAFRVASAANLGVFNVREYGAVGDGVTDDIAAIEAAIAAMTVAVTNPDAQGIANVGQTLFFPPGIYRVSRAVNIYRAITVEGVGGPLTGRNASVLYPDQGACGFIIHDWGTAPTASPSTASGTTIQGMNIVSNRSQTKWAWPTNWAALTSYSAGNTVSPVGSSTRGSGTYDLRAYGFYLQCSTAGTSGATEPTWKVLPPIPVLEATFTEPRDNPDSPLQGGNAANDGTDTRWIQKRAPSGVVAFTSCTIRDCYIANFGGFGVWIGAEAHAEVGNYNGTTPFGGVAGLTNANGFLVSNVRASECNYAFMVIGADANAGVFHSCTASNSDRGFNDRSSFGCNWDGGQIENCTTMGVYAHGASCSAKFDMVYQESNNGPSYLNQSALMVGGSNSAAFTSDTLGTALCVTNGYSSTFMQFGNATKVSNATHVIQVSERAPSAALLTWWAQSGQSSAGINVFRHRFINTQSGNCGFWSFNYDTDTYAGLSLGAANNRNGVSMPFHFRGLYIGPQSSDEATMLLHSYSGAPSGGFWRSGWVSLNSNAYTDGIASYICAGGNAASSTCGAGTAVAAWASGTGYKAGDVIVESSKLFRCQVEGVTGNSKPAGFATATLGQTVGSDGGTYPITWENIGSPGATFLPQPLQGGRKVINLASDADYTLVKPTECFYEYIDITDTAPNLTAARDIVLPALDHQWKWVKNSTAFPLTFKASGQTGVMLLPGQGCNIYCDGTDWYDANGTLAAQAAVVTSDATATTLASYTPADGSVVSITAEVIAKNVTDTSGARYIVRKVYRRSGSSLTEVGSTANPVDAQEEASMSSADCTIDASGAVARVRVTGIAAKTIRWRCVRQTVEAL